MDRPEYRARSWWGLKTLLVKLTCARPWNWQVIRVFFTVVRWASRQQNPTLHRIYRRLMLFAPDHRAYTYGVVLPLTVEVQEDLSAEGDAQVLPIDLIKDALRKAGYIASMNVCVCRDSANCTSFAKDVCCLFLSKAGRQVVDHGVAYEVTLEEALARVDRAAELGLVGQALWVEVEQFIWGISPHAMDQFMEICFCCPCCCVGMEVCHNGERDIKGHFHSSGFQAVVDQDACVACEACIEPCIEDAISLATDSPAGPLAINHDWCVGCGICVEACPVDALGIERTGPTYPSLQEQFLHQGRLRVRL